MTDTEKGLQSGSLAPELPHFTAKMVLSEILRAQKGARDVFFLECGP